MKKLIPLVLLLFLFPSLVFAAGSVTVTQDTGITMRSGRSITLFFLADPSGTTFAETTINNATSGINGTLHGWKLHKVHLDGDHAVTHDGADGASALSDTNAGFYDSQWVDYTIINTTDDSSSGTVTANTRSTVTATLSGGTDNDWDNGDTGYVGTEPTENGDVFVYMNGIDVLDGNGVDQLDNSTEREVYPAIDGQASDILIVDDIVVALSGNSVSGADVLIKLELR